MSVTLNLPNGIETIPEALAFWADQTPNAPSLQAVNGRELRFLDLARAVAAVSARLANYGVECHDRVAFVTSSGFDLGVALLGTMATAAAAPLNPLSTPHELRRDLRRLSARLVVTGGSSAAGTRAVAASLGMATVAIDELVLADRDARLAHRGVKRPCIGPESIATILHTSGTTGFPKRVPRPHRTLLATARIGRDRMGLARDDVALVAHALHTGSGVVNMLAALVNGGACVLAPGFDPVQFPVWLDEHRPTWTVATTTELDRVFRAATTAGQESIVGPGSRLRMVRAGGQPMTPGMVERADRRLRAAVLDEYGMTEASCIAVSGPAAGDRRDGSCGRTIPGTVRILDENGEDASPGRAGEIVVRGPTLFPGYLDDPAANAAAFLPGGWFRTGDLGRLDDEGFLFLTGRMKEQINCGGEKIAPAEVDRRLLDHPAVAEAATFGVPDDELGEDIVAAVVVQPGATISPRALRAWMLDTLSAYKVPRRIRFVTALPRTETGKVRRGKLSRHWQERRQ